MHPEALKQDVLPRQEVTIFERCWWFYAICREYLFTDHTDEITQAVLPLRTGHRLTDLLEVGCGPGFYARRFAALLPESRVTGIDLCEPLLVRAREQAKRSRLTNCRFLRADALSLSNFPEQMDVVIASRLFLILHDRLSALGAIFSTLRPGGLCFIAEPQSSLSALLPLRLMQLASLAISPTSTVQMPSSCEVLTHQQFGDFLSSQPWRSVDRWSDKGYHFAVCEKAA